MEKYKEIIEVQVQGEDKGKRVDFFLSEYLENTTRSYIQKLIDEKNIVIDGKEKIKSGNKLKGIEKILVRIPQDEMLEILPEDIKIDIVYEDKDMVVINKDPGVIVHPAQGYYTGTLVNAVLYHIKDLSNINGVIRPGIVHRLDKDTSGLIIIAKNNISHVKLTEMFKDKTIEKRYVCICKGNFKKEIGRVETLIGRDSKDRKKMAVVTENGKKAISNYKVLDSVNNFSLVEVGIETGRTHQIRVHMKSLNHPIVGDSVYGSPTDIAKRQMLHSYFLEFIHPITNEKIKILGALKDDFLSVLNKLKLNKETILELNK
ncbi:RluA family pseudouridine synthase [uncultured Cetobacterium sp.]|uniref:RluA family pseudouridine synthase n=1 Tax=uncultured Cetobacterium sp. TaxID=527638 RepID=UPI00260B9BF3|nr:RluA family pseudouridine synthase [uncultured Cetobacterium sp.]